ncbi:MAG TPA: OmpA family protein [Geminicoccaceae bacterium]|nr:OmpA family protein [Geminicoccaceae bacterium]
MPNRTAGIQSRVALALAAAMCVGGGGLQLHAQEDVVWTKEQIVERLARSEPEPLTRSLRGIVVGGGGAAGASAEPAATGWIGDLRVTFPFDSAEITPEAKANLDILGAALLDGRLRADRFEIAGHTDGVGDETYNTSLSERRAQAVVEYLEMKFAIPAERLLGRGYGETYLVNPDNPSDPENRRVEVLNLGNG